MSQFENEYLKINVLKFIDEGKGILFCIYIF